MDHLRKLQVLYFFNFSALNYDDALLTVPLFCISNTVLLRNDTFYKTLHPLLSYTYVHFKIIENEQPLFNKTHFCHTMERSVDSSAEKNRRLGYPIKQQQHRKGALTIVLGDRALTSDHR